MEIKVPTALFEHIYVDNKHIILIYLVCLNDLLYVLDPVKEYGCAPWPMVEKLIKKCLKENPQERPTSAQVQSC